jgi:hypothetical protein
MEDYFGAYQIRKQDAEALLGLEKHGIAAFHLGGIAIECRLKALLIAYHRIEEWQDKSRRPKDSMTNQPIQNPGHSLMMAMKHMPDLWKPAKSSRQFIEHLGRIIHPLGETYLDYIQIRYYITQASAIQQRQWQESFIYVCGWLNKNARVVI